MYIDARAMFKWFLFFRRCDVLGTRLVRVVHDKRLEGLHFGRVGRFKCKQHESQTVPDALRPRFAGHLCGDRYGTGHGCFRFTRWYR